MLVGDTFGIFVKPVIAKVFFINHDVNVFNFAKLAKFNRRELDLLWAASAKNVHVGDRRGLEPLIDVRRNIGLEHVICMLCKHASHVECHVAVAQNCNFLRGERPGERHVRVAVIPAHKIGCTKTAIKVDAGHIQLGVFDCAGCKDHRVVMLTKVS